jgi:putative transposase
MIAKLCGPGGVRAVIAENFLLKQQLIVLRRARQRAPNLLRRDRLVCGFWSLFLSAGRIRKVAALRRSSRFTRRWSVASAAVCFHRGRAPRSPDRKGRMRHSLRPSSNSRRAILASAVHESRVSSRAPSGSTSTRTSCTACWRNIIALLPAAPDLRGCRSSATPETACGASTLSLRVDRAPDLLGCSWSWTRSRVASSAWASHGGAITGADLCRMFNAAIHGQGAPRHLSTDHDPLFEAHRWRANLRILEINEIKTVPYAPRSHPFVERLIGTMRREFPDHVLFWNAGDLERKLREFQTDYNAARSHASLDGHPPLTFAGGHSIRWPLPISPMCVGSPTAGTSSSRWLPPDNDFETHRRSAGDGLNQR